MPRISRTAVEFEAEGRMWVAEFLHQHALRKPSGKLEAIQYQIKDGADRGKFIKLLHLTMCKLRHKDAPKVWTTGHAPCSLKDVYRWQRGLHLSLQRCLERLGACRMVKKGSKLVVEDRKPLYDAVTTAFWREIAIPSVRTVTAEVVPFPAELVLPGLESVYGDNAHEYTGKQHGMGWAGD